MKFLLMTRSGTETAAPPSPELMGALGKLNEELTKSGVLLQAGGLQSSSIGAHLRLSGGKVTVLDGPYTETKELIGGYAIVQVKSNEEAIELGRRFLQLHADILGASYEAESEIRRLYDRSELGPQKH
jgi:hypothetical protein